MAYTLVTFHAHPDDETITTSGTMARAKAEGHRVVLVVATQGELGEVQDGVLAADETLGERRIAETHAAAKVLGLDRVEFLGFHDSGMHGEESNHADAAFASADTEVAAERLAAILREEHADVLTIYDDHGGYGHPDHIQVHRVGVRAAELANTPVVLEATMNRDYIRELMTEAADLVSDLEAAPPDPTQMDDFGSPDAIITTYVDVREFLGPKRESMVAHASQIPADSWFLQLPPEAFEAAFGTEWYIRRGAPAGTRDESVFAGLETDT